MHPHFVPTGDKLELIAHLARTGVKSIEVTSFVHPERVPQHADADEVGEKIKPVSGVRFRALYLNEKGLERASKHKKLSLEGYVLLSASESFQKKNTNRSQRETIELIPNWLDRFSELGLRFERMMISTAFGYQDEGAIEASAVLSLCADAIAKAEEKSTKIEEVTFADTTGWANPNSVQKLVGEFRSRWPDIEVGLHLHDTRGSAMANVYAGLLEGVSRFDCSVGGMGGCPFAKGAAGNVPTEDVAFLCEELGISTGVDLEKYIAAANFAEKLIGRPLPGKLKSAGLLSSS